MPHPNYSMPRRSILVYSLTENSSTFMFKLKECVWYLHLIWMTELSSAVPIGFWTWHRTTELWYTLKTKNVYFIIPYNFIYVTPCHKFFRFIHTVQSVWPFYKFYSTLLHLPPLRFRCAGRCWDWTQNCCIVCIGSQMMSHMPQKSWQFWS